MVMDSQWGDAWKPGETRNSRLVFIGRGLDQAALREGFDACQVKGRSLMLAAEMERDGACCALPLAPIAGRSVGANVTALTFGAGTVYAGLGDGRVVAMHKGEIRDIAQRKGAVTALSLSGDALSPPVKMGAFLIEDGAPKLTSPKPDWITHVSHSDDGTQVLVAGKRVEVIEGGQVIAGSTISPPPCRVRSFITRVKPSPSATKRHLAQEIERFSSLRSLPGQGRFGRQRLPR